MRIVVANCLITYEGRGSSVTDEAGVRALIIKASGAISIHGDHSGNKPLNYMSQKNDFTVEHLDNGEQVWTFANKDEQIAVHILEIVSDTAYELAGYERGITMAGTEKHLQAWLAEHTELFGEGTELISREFLTGAGAVDLFVKTADDKYVAVEVKRAASNLNYVYQAIRYSDALTASGKYGIVKPVLAAVSIKPNVAKLAEQLGVDFIEVPKNWKEIE
jgi:RecB family endonuclease NucS